MKLTTLKMAVFTPTPSASVMIIIIANNRFFTIIRQANCMYLAHMAGSSAQTRLSQRQRQRAGASLHYKGAAPNACRTRRARHRAGAPPLADTGEEQANRDYWPS